MRFQPTDEQWAMLDGAVKDLQEIGDFTHYPTTPVHNMPESKLRTELMALIEPNQCYDNTMELITYLVMEKGFNPSRLRYVTGVAASLTALMPAPHAWLRIDGEYFDLSWQSYSHQKVEANNYHAMAELTTGQLFVALEANGFVPPCPVAILRFTPEYLNV